MIAWILPLLFVIFAISPVPYCCAADLVESAFMNFYVGDDTYAQGVIQLKPIHGSVATILDDDGAEGDEESPTYLERLHYTAAIWIQYDTINNYLFDYAVPATSHYALEARELYLDFDAQLLRITAGKFLNDIGFNTAINPSDPSPLDYYDPIHPNRLGVWGISGEIEGFHCATFINQGPLWVNNGPYRFLPENVKIIEYRYENELGYALWYEGESEWLRYGLTYYNGVNDLPVLTPVEIARPNELVASYEKMSSFAASIEVLFDTFTLRNELVYRDLEADDSYGWGVLELSRTFTIGEWEKALNFIGYLAYTTGSNNFVSYDRLRKQSAGFQAMYDLFDDGSVKLGQELSIGTEEDDLYTKTIIRYNPISSLWIDLHYQYTEIHDAPNNKLSMLGLTVSKWF